MELEPVNYITRNLRDNSRKDGITEDRIISAIHRVGEIWESRLCGGWMPPEETVHPWAQIRLSLAALLPGLKKAQIKSESNETLAGSFKGNLSTDTPLSALILAGNTPLMSWAPISACLLAGWAVVVKMSREETLWPRLFLESLADADTLLAARVSIHVWPGEEGRTAELCRCTDAVIAYGSDSTIDALRKWTPDSTPFFGFGHSISIGVGNFDNRGKNADSEIESIISGAGIDGFARDMLMFDQNGCLSPQFLLVKDRTSDRRVAKVAAKRIADALIQETKALEVSAVTNFGEAKTIREARDLALFAGATLYEDASLRWTVACYDRYIPPFANYVTGNRFLPVIPVEGMNQVVEICRTLRGRLSCIGIAGGFPEAIRQEIQVEGVSRVCQAGEMQCPPLDWRNGNRDLVRELHNLRLSGLFR